MNLRSQCAGIPFSVAVVKDRHELCWPNCRKTWAGLCLTHERPPRGWQDERRSRAGRPATTAAPRRPAPDLLATSEVFHDSNHIARGKPHGPTHLPFTKPAGGRDEDPMNPLAPVTNTETPANPLQWVHLPGSRFRLRGLERNPRLFQEIVILKQIGSALNEIKTNPGPLGDVQQRSAAIRQIQYPKHR